MNQETQYPNESRSQRIGVGLFTALSLHQTIYVAGGIIAEFWEKHYGSELAGGGSSYGQLDDTANSPVWLLCVSILLLTMIRYFKPRLIEWTIPFTLFVGYWFLTVIAIGWYPIGQAENQAAAFARTMFAVCGGIWAPAMLLAFLARAKNRSGIKNKPDSPYFNSRESSIRNTRPQTPPEQITR